MAMQTHIHSQNLRLPNSTQNYIFMDNNNNNNLFSNEFNHNNFQRKFLQHQQMKNQQLQYMVHQNYFVFSQSSKKQKLAINPTTTTSSSTTSEIDDHDSMSFSAQIEKHRQEIDRFINLQNERLKLTLQEQRKQQMMEIIKKLEAKAMQLLKQKDNEITRANKKTMELLEIMRKMEFENQTWQKVALENESLVFSLNNTLDQLKQQQQDCSSKSSNCVGYVESSCNIFDNNKNNIKRNEETTTKRKGELCKVCNSRNVCVLMLPCKHLCCCNVCDGFLEACPLCKSSKIASIEAIFS